MLDATRQMKIAVMPAAFENQLAIKIEEENNRTNFYQANLFMDFKEFLMDVYMEPGEFEKCWEQFEQWYEKEQPSTGQPTQTTNNE